MTHRPSLAIVRAVAAGIPLGPNGGIVAHGYLQDPQSGAGNCICGRDQGHQLHADAEQEKHTGGMVALFPRSDYAEMLAVPGGEPIEDLHVTLAFLGEDVTSTSPRSLGAAIARVVDQYPGPIAAKIFGHAIFNPDGNEGFDPCAVYLVGHSPDLPQIHKDILEAADQTFPLPEQHEPWLPHITAGYGQVGNPPEIGEYTGEVIFDRVGLAFAGRTQFYPFGDADPQQLTGYREVRWPFL